MKRVYQYSSEAISAAILTVEEENYKTLLETRRKFEIYAKNIGMISKTYKNLQFKFGSSKPIKGEEYYFNVTNYGVE